MTALEENGGSDGNSSVAELEVRVETLEGTAADHETRISTAESDVEGLSTIVKTGKRVSLMKKLKFYHFTIIVVALEAATSGQEIRLSAAEENIQGILHANVVFEVTKILTLFCIKGTKTMNYP